jgi:hypothetical protein
MTKTREYIDAVCNDNEEKSSKLFQQMMSNAISAEIDVQYVNTANRIFDLPDSGTKNDDS